MLKVPNVPTDDTPIGLGEDDNVVIKTVGEPRKFDFKIKSHWELAQLHDLIDKDRAAKIAGSRFAYIKGDLVRLQFAMLHFAMDNLTDQKVIQKIIKDNNLTVSDKPFVPVFKSPVQEEMSNKTLTQPQVQSRPEFKIPDLGQTVTPEKAKEFKEANKNTPNKNLEEELEKIANVIDLRSQEK